MCSARLRTSRSPHSDHSQDVQLSFLPSTTETQSRGGNPASSHFPGLLVGQFSGSQQLLRRHSTQQPCPTSSQAPLHLNSRLTFSGGSPLYLPACCTSSWGFSKHTYFLGSHTPGLSQGDSCLQACVLFLLSVAGILPGPWLADTSSVQEIPLGTNRD